MRSIDSHGISSIRDNMSTKVDELTSEIARRVAAERQGRGWSLGDLAEKSGVSKAMLSKVEREEASPTATILARIAAAFEVTLAELLTSPTADEARFLRRDAQPVWTDPATGYIRRQIFISTRVPLEVVAVQLPAHASVSVSALSFHMVHQVLWVTKGQVVILEGDERTALGLGDRLEFGPVVDRTYRNETDHSCEYSIAIARR
jgi:transcriptional regulator with XRE-family HTH domain